MAGDPERIHMRKVEKDGGINYHVNLMEAMVCAMTFVPIFCNNVSDNNDYSNNNNNDDDDDDDDNNNNTLEIETNQT